MKINIFHARPKCYNDVEIHKIQSPEVTEDTTVKEIIDLVLGQLPGSYMTGNQLLVEFVS